MSGPWAFKSSFAPQSVVTILCFNDTIFACVVRLFLEQCIHALRVFASIATTSLMSFPSVYACILRFSFQCCVYAPA